MKGSPVAYSDAELTFIHANSALPRRSLHALFVERFGRDDVTRDNIKSLCTRRGWDTGRTPWRPADDALLRELYADASTEEIARRLGRTLQATYGRAQELGLEKSEAYLATACRFRPGVQVSPATQFKKGHVSANKGVRRPGWSVGRMKETQFRNGQRTGIAVEKYKPVGFERVNDGGYLVRKIHDGRPFHTRWRAVHLIRWEARHGPVPEGMALKCLDGDKLNTEPSNWEAVPRGLLPRLNGKSGRNYDTAPAELKPTILAIAKLEHAAREARRSRRSA